MSCGSRATCAIIAKLVTSARLTMTSISEIQDALATDSTNGLPVQAGDGRGFQKLYWGKPV